MKRLDEVPAEGPLYLYCETGGRVSGASSYLQSKGYDVVVVDDDFTNWTGAHAEATMVAV